MPLSLAEVPYRIISMPSISKFNTYSGHCLCGLIGKFDLSSSPGIYSLLDFIWRTLSMVLPIGIHPSGYGSKLVSRGVLDFPSCLKEKWTRNTRHPHNPSSIMPTGRWSASVIHTAQNSCISLFYSVTRERCESITTFWYQWARFWALPLLCRFHAASQVPYWYLFLKP